MGYVPQRPALPPTATAEEMEADLERIRNDIRKKDRMTLTVFVMWFIMIAVMLFSMALNSMAGV